MEANRYTRDPTPKIYKLYTERSCLTLSPPEKKIIRRAREKKEIKAIANI